MSYSLTSMDQVERTVLRLGGLAGILGGIVFTFVPIVLFGFVPPAPSDPTQVVARFPSIALPLTIGNNLNFISDMLDLALLVALYRALRGTSLAPALFGTVMSILGLGVIFTETQTQVAFAPLSGLYHASTTTPAQQITLSQIWTATQAMFFELDTAAGLLLALGFVVLATAMMKAPGFGKTTGSVSAVLAAIAFVGIALIPVLGETSIVAVLAVPVFIVLPILWGWKLYRLSKIM